MSKAADRIKAEEVIKDRVRAALKTCKRPLSESSLARCRRALLAAVQECGLSHVSYGTSVERGRLEVGVVLTGDDAIRLEVEL